MNGIFYRYLLSIFLIADIDTPRGGLIHVVPQNLEALMTGFPPDNMPPR